MGPAIYRFTNLLNSVDRVGISVNFLAVLCDHATISTWRERFHRDTELLCLAVPLFFFCCFFLSLTILNTFENKKGIIKILVYKSVIVIIQIDVIFFAL